jgi:hypothetical protein
MDDSKIIDELGGTGAVAAMFEPPIKPPSVSEWRKKGIPDDRRQILKLLRPDVFGLAATPGCECQQSEATA